MQRSLEIQEDMTFQRRSWMVERIGWAVMALLLVAAALGVFAVGPLSWTTVRDPRGLLAVEYERMQRQSAPVVFKLQVAREAITPDGITIEVDAAFADTFKISTMSPQPTRSTARANGLRLQFAAESDAAATTFLYVSPERIGFSRPRVALSGREPLDLPVFIYP